MDSTEPDPHLREVLADLSYPADKWQIVTCADVYGFDSAVRRSLYALPVRRYRSAAEVEAEMGALLHANPGGQR
ncbi:MAG: DUF2795 domain-containing protein [Labedaea sp.]